MTFCAGSSFIALSILIWVRLLFGSLPARFPGLLPQFYISLALTKIIIRDCLHLLCDSACLYSIITELIASNASSALLMVAGDC